jgi:uncharacterized cupin superfamily protein
MENPRPAFIKHYSEIQTADDAHYPNSDELLSIGSPFGKCFGLKKIGIHHELLPPGRRTSYPHAEADEEEFVYVIEGHPDVWIDGELFALKPGDGVGFPSGTGISHTFLNNTTTDVRLLVVGEKIANCRVYYPKNPERKKDGVRWWEPEPAMPLGSHNGKPNQGKSVS